MTQQTKEQLEELLGRMRKKQGKIAKEKMDAADSRGDTHDNAPYEDALRRLEMTVFGIADIESKLRNAKLISPNTNTDVVGIGHEVTLRLEGEEKNFTILGSLDSDPKNGRISFESPFARAAINHKPHERITIKTPGGVISAEIVAFKPGEF